MILEAGEILVRRGLVNQSQLDESRAAMNGGGIIESVVQKGFVKEEVALKAIADEFGIDYIDLREANIDLELLNSFPQKLIYRHAILPVRKEGRTAQLFRWWQRRLKLPSLLKSILGSVARRLKG